MIAGHTVITRNAEGRTDVQHFGAGHVVEGSEIVVEVPVGATLVIRHFHNPNEVSDTPDD